MASGGTGAWGTGRAQPMQGPKDPEDPKDPKDPEAVRAELKAAGLLDAPSEEAFKHALGLWRAWRTAESIQHWVQLRVLVGVRGAAGRFVSVGTALENRMSMEESLDAAEIRVTRARQEFEEFIEQLSSSATHAVLE